MNDFTTKLNYLFSSIKPLGREYFNREVSEGTRAFNNKKIISEAYIRRLRAGQLDNPSLIVIQALSKFFNVPTSYFFDSEIDSKYRDDFLSKLNDMKVLNIALRVEDLSEQSITHITRIIDSFREVEGLSAYNQSNIYKKFQDRDSE